MTLAPFAVSLARTVGDHARRHVIRLSTLVLSFLLVLGSLTAADTTAELIAHWKLDDTDGVDDNSHQTVLDATTNDNDGHLGKTAAPGQITDPTWSNDVKVGTGSLYFDGGDYVKIADTTSSNPTGSITW